MGKHRNAPKGGCHALKGISPTPLSHAGETGDMGDVVHDLRDAVASLEEALSQMGASSMTPFHFTQCGKSPSEQFSLPEH